MTWEELAVNIETDESYRKQLVEQIEDYYSTGILDKSIDVVVTLEGTDIKITFNSVAEIDPAQYSWLSDARENGIIKVSGIIDICLDKEDCISDLVSFSDF